MKTLLALLFPCLLFSQVLDTAGVDADVRKAVSNIISNKNREIRYKEASLKLDEARNRQRTKQIRLLQEIKNEIAKLTNRTESADKYVPLTKAEIRSLGLKPEEYFKIIHEQEVLWEQKPLRGVRRLFSKRKYRLLPYIVDEHNAKIYLSFK